ncbi:hypothetical protein ERJ75_001226400 [Trypanosoma vivax]|uniref:Uncharacterized protein n=1 Tax=Trypanosoma vivax (strain Y486) TaxID=1055687 RepID=G0U1B3_TRYVY|nr:hypothetical protein TRVL_01588 [Trypanosoma vivax]KAH8608820.1 hypothetical protein ERJ75_001226400 [Trypanosoma vivax]CCC49868.1 conserved hypothetical protein [Trypanosoma vivax Y486]
MPQRVFVNLHPIDGCSLSEEELARAAHVAFAEARCHTIKGAHCSFSSARLQQIVKSRLPRGYEQIIDKGVWCRKWHLFLMERAGFVCFNYRECDYLKAEHLAVHIPPTELRCRLVEDHYEDVRQADNAIGLLLQAEFLQPDVLNATCKAETLSVATAAWRVIPPPRWYRVSYEASCIIRLLEILEGRAVLRYTVNDRLQRRAAAQLVQFILKDNRALKHLSVSKLRRLVTNIVISWKPVVCATPDDKHQVTAHISSFG